MRETINTNTFSNQDIDSVKNQIDNWEDIKELRKTNKITSLIF